MTKAELEAKVRGGPSVVSLLGKAGMLESFVERNRAFSSRWIWDDGETTVATVWLHELTEIGGTLVAAYENPATDDSLTGARRTRAVERFQTLTAREGSPIAAIVQRLDADALGDPAAPKSRARCLDDVPWYSIRDQGTVRLQRGVRPVEPATSLSELNVRSVPRQPTKYERENRPDQIAFRERVSAKTGRRCPLTGAPEMVCDAAHFTWTDWRTDNEAHHGVLLRADLHAALDKGLIAILESGVVEVSPQLIELSSDYQCLHGKRVPIHSGRR